MPLLCTTTTLVPVEMSTMILVQMGEGLAIMPLATIPTNVKKDDDINTVLTSRMDTIIATVWKKKLCPRDLIWSVLQSPFPKHPRSRCNSPVNKYMPT